MERLCTDEKVEETQFSLSDVVLFARIRPTPISIYSRETEYLCEVALRIVPGQFHLFRSTDGNLMPLRPRRKIINLNRPP